MTDEEVKQACIDIWRNSMALFDLVDQKGKDAPLEDISAILNLKTMLDKIEALRAYYERRNIQRMLALGVSPADLMKMAANPQAREQLDKLKEQAGG